MMNAATAAEECFFRPLRFAIWRPVFAAHVDNSDAPDKKEDNKNYHYYADQAAAQIHLLLPRMSQATPRRDNAPMSLSASNSTIMTLELLPTQWVFRTAGELLACKPNRWIRHELLVEIFP